MRIGVLASGSGTILEAIIAKGIAVSLVITDRPCRALDVAASAGIAYSKIERSSFGPDFDRDGYTGQVVSELEKFNIDLVVMAGYGTVLGSSIHKRFGLRILNTHPSLLPSFPGWHAVEAALEYGVKITGCTVHLATLKVDAGPILAQEVVRILPDDTKDTLHERIKEIERVLYPATIMAFADHLERSLPGRFDLGMKVVRDEHGLLVLQKIKNSEEL